MTRKRKYFFPRKKTPGTRYGHSYSVQITISLFWALRSRKEKHKSFLQSGQRKKDPKQSRWCSQFTLWILLWMVLQASRAVWKPTELGSPWLALLCLAPRDFLKVTLTLVNCNLIDFMPKEHYWKSGCMTFLLGKIQLVQGYLIFCKEFFCYPFLPFFLKFSFSASSEGLTVGT